MTLRQIAAEGDWADPVEKLVAVLSTLRFAITGKLPAEEHIEDLVNNWTRQYGSPKYQNIDRWLDELGSIADTKIPYKKYLKAMMAAGLVPVGK